MENSRIDMIGLNGNTGECYTVRYENTLYKMINGFVHYQKSKEVWRQSMRQDFDFFLKNGNIVLNNIHD